MSDSNPASVFDPCGSGASGGGGVGGSGSGIGGALVTAGGPIDPAVEALAGRRGNTKARVLGFDFYGVALV